MKSDNFISDFKRPFWHLIFAACFFALALTLLLFECLDLKLTNFSFRHFSNKIPLIVLLFILGFNFSYQKKILFDKKNCKIKSVYVIGFLEFGKWKNIKDFKYVAVFFDGKFKLNIWYSKNKHITLYETDNYSECMYMAFELSEELNIDLLDSTVAGEFKWIDKEQWKAKANETSA